MSQSHSSPILAALREATKEIHERLEATPLSQSLISPTLKQEKYEQVLTLFGTWFVAAERALKEHQDCIAAELDEARFQRETWLREDLPGKDLALPVLPPIPKAEMPGWLYVVEGSSLGGKQISRHLQAREEATGHSWPTRFFEAYGAETGPRWQSFLQFLEQKAPAGSPDFEAVVRGAIDAFESFHQWQISHPENATPVE